MADPAIAEYIYRLDAEERITFVNRAWLDFARENWPQGPGEAVVGELLWDHLSDPGTRELYQILLAKVRGQARPVRFAFRCDSPGLRRYMEMEMRPLPQGAVEMHSRLLREEPRPDEPWIAQPASGDNPLMTMCSWCKKVRIHGPGEDEHRWLEVEEASDLWRDGGPRSMPTISHGACPSCHSNLIRLVDDNA